MKIGVKNYVVPAEAYYITIPEMESQLDGIRSMNFGVMTDRLIEYIIGDRRFLDMEKKPADCLELVKPMKVLVQKNSCGFLFSYELDEPNGIGILYANGSFVDIGPRECARRRHVSEPA